MSVEFICENCKQPFFRANKKTARFCSHKCQGKFEKKSVFAPCENCGKPLEREPSWAKRVKHFFCDKKCHNEWQDQHYARGKDNSRYTSITVECAACRKSLERRPYRIRDYENHFCDAKCRGRWLTEHQAGENHPNWKGGITLNYGVDWQEQRRKARKRDKYKCQHCGVSEKRLGRELDVHHIRPFRTFDGDHETANRLTNLISLCAICHRAAENEKIPIQPFLIE